MYGFLKITESGDGVQMMSSKCCKDRFQETGAKTMGAGSRFDRLVGFDEPDEDDGSEDPVRSAEWVR